MFASKTLLGGGRKFFVGGNFKANGSLADAAKLLATLNSGLIASR